MGVNDMEKRNQASKTATVDPVDPVDPALGGDRENEECATKTVRMTRDSTQFPEPHSADVHPDEVENMRPHGWIVSESKD